jgi:hypothetical protein
LGNQSHNDDLDSDDVENLHENSNSSEASQDNEEEEDETWYSYFKEAIKAQAYNLIGFERFKTQPKKPKYSFIQ